MLNKLDTVSLTIVFAVFIISFCLLYFTNDNMFQMDYLSIGIISLLVGIVCGVLYFKNKRVVETNTTNETVMNVDNPPNIKNDQPMDTTSVLTNRPSINRGKNNIT